MKQSCQLAALSRIRPLGAVADGHVSRIELRHGERATQGQVVHCAVLRSCNEPLRPHLKQPRHLSSTQRNADEVLRLLVMVANFVARQTCPCSIGWVPEPGAIPSSCLALALMLPVAGRHLDLIFRLVCPAQAPAGMLGTLTLKLPMSHPVSMVSGFTQTGI